MKTRGWKEVEGGRVDEEVNYVLSDTPWQCLLPQLSMVEVRHARAVSPHPVISALPCLLGYVHHTNSYMTGKF